MDKLHMAFTAAVDDGGTKKLQPGGSEMTTPITNPPTVDLTRGRSRNVSSPTEWHRPNVNIAPIERAGRIVIGISAVAAGAVLLATAASVLAVVFEVLLIAAGLDLLVTGALGHCPLYAKLGHVPKSLRSSP
jgi:hypothetical protein